MKGALRRALDDKVETVKELRKELESTLYRLTVENTEGAEANHESTDDD